MDGDKQAKAQRLLMGTWFAFIIFPCVASIILIRASNSKKLRVSKKGSR